MFIGHKLSDDGVLTLYLDPGLTEFADVRGINESKRENLHDGIKKYIKNKLPDFKGGVVKVIVGGLLVTSLFFPASMVEANAAQSAYTQSVSQDIKVKIDGRNIALRKPAVLRDGTTFVPIRDIAEALGAEVWWNGVSRTVGINKGDTNIAFVIGSTTARVNGKEIRMMPSYIVDGTTMVPVRFVSEALGLHVDWDGATRTVSILPSTYTVKSGDTLFKIATLYGTSVASIQKANNMTGTEIYPGQKLQIGKPEINQPAIQTPQAANQENTVTYITYTIASGDNMWDLSQKFGLPMAELLKANNMTTSSTLSVGQKITVPVHHIAVKATPSEKHGEYLDWWTEAQYVFPIGKVATVTDFATGRSFQVKRTIGANHADCEPLTATDAAIIKEVWGGSYSWKERAVIVKVDGRKIAASMASMPHDVSYIKDNNFNGHFDIHFKNSTRHNDGKVTPAHQTQIKIAAGV